MRASVASLSKKFVNAVFAATLALGLVPAAAFAAPEGNDVVAAVENSDAADAAIENEDQTQGAPEFDQSPNDVILDGEGEALGVEESPGSEIPEAEAGSQGETAEIPALDVINQEVALDAVVAQAESTRTFFLAQTLESTRTVPIVSAKLPLDTSAGDRADQSSAPTDQPASSSEEEGDDGADDPDPEGDIQEDSVAVELARPSAETQDGTASAVSSESTVIGSFTYLGMTFAMEPGGETVALVAVDYNQLPEGFVQRQVIVIPEAAQTSDGDMFSVTRVADGAFASLTADAANQDYLGCELLFSDEELLAEAGFTLEDVSEYLTPAADADVSLDGWVPDKSGTYEKQDGSDSSEDLDDIRTIVSMEGNVATLDDGSTYTFTNPLAGKAGILAVGIPASVSEIGDEALEGASSLQYLVVSEDNPNFASCDGALYSADLTQLRLIPEGRVGAVRVASSATTVNTEVFSHCPLVDAVVADADGGLLDISFEGINQLSYSELADELPTNPLIILLISSALGSDVWNAASQSVEALQQRVALLASNPSTEPSFLPSGARILYLNNAIGTENTSSSRYVYGYNSTAYSGWTQNLTLLEPGTSASSFSYDQTWGNYRSHYNFEAHRMYYIHGYGFVQLRAYADATRGWTWAALQPLNGGKVTRATAYRYSTPSSSEWTTGQPIPTGYAYLYESGSSPVYLGDSDHFANVSWCIYANPPNLSAGTSIVLTSATAKTDYVFTGWKTNFNDTFIDKKESRYVLTSVDVSAIKAAASKGEAMEFWAQWDYDEHDVLLDRNYGDAVADENTPRVWLKLDKALPSNLKDADASEYGDAKKPYNESAGQSYSDANTGDSLSRSNINIKSLWQREGYEFNGFWTTRYSEDPQKAEYVNGKSVVPRQYYDANFNTITETNSDGLWHEESPDFTRLYAHWKYKIVLDLNAYDGYGNPVLDEGGSGVFEYAAALGSEEGVRREVLVLGGKKVVVFTFEAIDGAPVTLPTVDRTGYSATGLWATNRSGAGPVVSDETNPVTASPFNPTLQVSGFTDFDGRALMLYADWSGHENEYEVTLASPDGFTPNGGSWTQKLNALYDHPLLMEVDGKTVVSADYLRDGKLVEVTAPAIKNADGTYRYVFNGYRDQRNDLDGEAGDEYIGAVAKTADHGYDGSDVAAVERIWNIAGPATLWAVWHTPVSRLTLDLQGGTLAGMTGSVAVKNADGSDFELEARKAIAEMPAAYATVPTRPGYTFRGYYTKSGSLAADPETAAFATFAETDDVTGYYERDGAAVKAAGVDGATLEWEFYTNQTLYAHWEYDIELATTDADEGATIGLKSALVAERTTDRFGNVHPASGSLASTYRIKALAGVPVLMPYAQGRMGYSDTCAWALKAGDAMGTSQEVKASGDAYTAAAGSLSAPGFTSVLSASNATVRLFVDWEGQARTYWVRLASGGYSAYNGKGQVNSYSAFTNASATTAQADVLVRVAYDQPVVQVRDGAGYVTVRNAAGEEVQQLLQLPHHGRALVGDDAIVNDNLEFAGFYAKAYGCLVDDGPGAGELPFVDANGTLDGCNLAFHETVSAAAETDPAAAVVLYARWVQPTSAVTFNLFDQPTPEASTQVSALNTAQSQPAAAIMLQKGASVGETGEAAGLSWQLKKLSERVVALQNDPNFNYTFGGFWSAPSGYEAWQEDERQGQAAPSDADKYPQSTPTCYYVLDSNNRLVPAASDGQWLTAEAGNFSATWLEDVPTTLYAHWKFDLVLAIDDDDRIPQADGGQGSLDSIMFGNGGNALDGAEVAQQVVFRDERFTDALGRITYGGPLELPMDRVTDAAAGIPTTDAVERIRNFGAGDALGHGYTGLGRTGYDFAGWSRSKKAKEPDAGPLSKSYSGALDSTDEHLRPLAGEANRGHVYLYAQWQARAFEVALDAMPAFWSDYVSETASPKENAAGEDVPTSLWIDYDATFRQARLAAGPVSATNPEVDAIAAPALHGFTFLAFWSSDDGLVNGSTVENAGVRYLMAADGDPAHAEATSQPWYVPLETLEGATPTIYAYYARQSYQLTFLTQDTGDGTLQEVEGEQSATRRVSYGDGLVRGAGIGSKSLTVDWENLMPTKLGFDRHGYMFDGWYVLKVQPQASDSAERQQALRSDPENRVYLFRCDSSNAAQVSSIYGMATFEGTAEDHRHERGTWFDQGVHAWVSAQLSGSDTFAFDAERSYTVYASWVPREYEVTYDPAYRNGEDYQVKVVKYRYEDMISREAGNFGVDPVAKGTPFEFLGWNKSTNTNINANTWLFDKTDYVPGAVERDEYEPMMPPTDAKPVCGRFMPSAQLAPSTSIYLYGVWREPEQRSIVLFSGTHGKLLQDDANKSIESYKVLAHPYDEGWELDETGLTFYSPDVVLSVDSGYTHVGWLEISPADIFGDAAGDEVRTSYAGVNRDAEEIWGSWAEGIASRVSARVRDNLGTYDLRYASTEVDEVSGARRYQAFPEKATVFDKTTGYVNPYDGRVTAEQGFEYRDIYLVAVYKQIGDYKLVLDLGARSVYGDDSSSLGAELSEYGVFSDVPEALSPNIKYEYTFDVEDANFALPAVASGLHDFGGWLYDGAPVESAGLPWLLPGTDGSPAHVDVAAYVRWASGAGREHTTTLTAKMTEKRYTVKFVSDHKGLDSEAEADEQVTLSGLSVGDTFDLPYPATRGEGGYFRCWTLKTVDGYGRDSRGQFAGGRSIELKSLLDAVNKAKQKPDTTFPDDSGTSAAPGSTLVAGVDVSDNTITFDAVWIERINVSVPMSVRVAVDPVNRSVLTDDGLQLSVAVNPDLGGDTTEDARKSYKIVSLRYDPVEATDAEGKSLGQVFDAANLGAGKAFLSIYADLVATGDTTHLFEESNVDAETGEILTGASQQYPPLLIDLTRPAVYSAKYPKTLAADGSEGKGSYDGLYDNAHVHEVEEGHEHGLADHGFRAFGASASSEDVTKRPLPVRYSLLFQNVPDILAAAPLLKELRADDAESSFEIAHLYYTISLA